MNFSTDIFHPLLVPSTTYTFSTGSSSDTDTVSATDDERLSPGGFSLRHGFPHWFGRAKRSPGNSAASSRNVSGSQPDSTTGDGAGDRKESSEEQKEDRPEGSTKGRWNEHDDNAVGVRVSPLPSKSVQSYSSSQIDVPAMELLNYIRSTFDNESVLDSVPLEAAGNPGAWHAWRSHRRSSLSKSSNDSKRVSVDGPVTAAGRTLSPDDSNKKGGPQARAPGEWNWEGVWAKRVQDGVRNSYLESVLFGGTSKPVNPSDDPVSNVNPRSFHRLDFNG